MEKLVVFGWKKLLNPENDESRVVIKKIEKRTKTKKFTKMKKCLIMKTTKTQIYFNSKLGYYYIDKPQQKTIISFINQIFIAVIYQYFS